MYMSFETIKVFYPKKKHLALQKVPNFERFENFQSYTPFNTLSGKNSPRIGALQKVVVFYQKTLFLLQREPKLWRFWEFQFNILFWDAL